MFLTILWLFTNHKPVHSTIGPPQTKPNLDTGPALHTVPDQRLQTKPYFDPSEYQDSGFSSDGTNSTISSSIPESSLALPPPPLELTWSSQSSEQSSFRHGLGWTPQESSLSDRLSTSSPKSDKFILDIEVEALDMAVAAFETFFVCPTVSELSDVEVQCLYTRFEEQFLKENCKLISRLTKVALNIGHENLGNEPVRRAKTAISQAMKCRHDIALEHERRVLGPGTEVSPQELPRFSGQGGLSVYKFQKSLQKMLLAKRIPLYAWGKHILDSLDPPAKNFCKSFDPWENQVQAMFQRLRKIFGTKEKIMSRSQQLHLRAGRIPEIQSVVSWANLSDQTENHLKIISELELFEAMTGEEPWDYEYTEFLWRHVLAASQIVDLCRDSNYRDLAPRQKLNAVIQQLEFLNDFSEDMKCKPSL